MKLLQLYRELKSKGGYRGRREDRLKVEGGCKGIGAERVFKRRDESIGQ